MDNLNDYLINEIQETEQQISDLKEDVKRNIDYFTGKSIDIFCAGRDSHIEELTALYTKLKTLYEVKRVHDYYRGFSVI